MLRIVCNIGFPLAGDRRYVSAVAKRVAPWNPNTADWLVKQRGARTQDAVVADMQARGVKLKRAWLSRIENGAPFSADLFAAFVEYYGSGPPAFEPPARVDADPTIASALSDLAVELRLSRESRADLERRLAALEPVVKRLAAQALEAPPKPRLPQAKAG